MMYRDELKIPLERVPIIIGKKGDVKKTIEKATSCKLKINSAEGLVEVISKESLDLYSAVQVVKAISRGFNPEIALSLEIEGTILEIINMQDFSGKSRAKLERLRGRCIGSKGKARHLIEELTSTNISVYGKTVSIIGDTENVSLARKAMESLLAGAKHGNIYKWLEKMRKGLKMRL